MEKRSTVEGPLASDAFGRLPSLDYHAELLHSSVHWLDLFHQRPEAGSGLPKAPPLPGLLAEHNAGLALLVDDPLLVKPPLVDAFGGRIWAELVRPGKSEAAERVLLEAAFKHAVKPVAGRLRLGGQGEGAGDRQGARGPKANCPASALVRTLFRSGRWGPGRCFAASRADRRWGRTPRRRPGLADLPDWLAGLADLPGRPAARRRL
jgi:hypothetical protein